MSKHRGPLLPLADFERISQSILGMLQSEKANLAASCLFFGLIGEEILRKHYKIDARAVVGQAAFVLNEGTTIAFAHRPQADSAGFHCWVEAQGWLLDFSSIVFPEMVKSVGQPACRRLMFQKPLVKAACSLGELQAEGDFHLLADGTMTQTHRARFHAVPAYDDLLNIVAEWYMKPPKTMPTIGVRDKYGHTKPVAIASQRLDGVW